MRIPKINQLLGAEYFSIETCPNNDTKNKNVPKKDNNQKSPTCKEFDAFQIDVHARSKDSICLERLPAVLHKDSCLNANYNEINMNDVGADHLHIDLVEHSKSRM